MLLLEKKPSKPYLEGFIHSWRRVLFGAYGKGLRSVKTINEQLVEPHAGFTCTNHNGRV